MSQVFIGYKHIISRFTIEYYTYLFVGLSETFHFDFRTKFRIAPRYSETQHHHQMPKTKTIWKFYLHSLTFLKSYVPAPTCSHETLQPVTSIE